MPVRQEDLAPIVDFDGVLDNLDRQGSLYDTLLSLSDQEREAISRADLAALTSIVATKERIVAEARQLEAIRMAACTRWAQEWGMATPPTIGEMRARAQTPAMAARLSAAALILTERVKRLRQVNSHNAHLLIQAQRMNQEIITVAHRFGNHPTYDNHGDAAQTRRPSIILDYRV